MNSGTLKLSPKYIDFIKTKTKRDYLEGTTAAGKTTVGIFKFMLMVADNNKKFHVIAGNDKGTVEKNIINSELGLLKQFEYLTEYNGGGSKNIELPHIAFETSKGLKIIYIVGYDNKARWKKVLGSQVGCVYVDEVNIADIEFIREISHRCDYMMTTNNPDDPKLPIYREFINRSRPLKRYRGDYPKELINELSEPAVNGWVHWYFTFYDNASMTQADIDKKKSDVPIGTKMYKNKIQGLRGRATGLVFNNFDERKHIITFEQAKKFKYIRFVCGIDTAYSSDSPDTISFIYVGITKCRKLVVLNERVYNNATMETTVAPSDVVKNMIEFLERNGKDIGQARQVYIDSADQATKKEFDKYKSKHGSIYILGNAWKKMKIVERIKTQIGWFASGDYLIVDSCKNHIEELNLYSWDETKDMTPEDGNDHTINASQYAWIPFIKEIGGIIDGNQ